MKKLYILIIMVYSSLVVVSPILGTKVVNLFGVKFTAGIFTMLAAFSLLDVVNELWGKNDARFLAVFIILIRIVIFVAIIPVVIRLPSYLEPSGYSSLLRMSIRTFLASEVNTLIQNVLIDIPIFHRLKRIKLGFFSGPMFPTSYPGPLEPSVLSSFLSGAPGRHCCRSYWARHSSSSRFRLFMPGLG
jgi:hypothetical protein